MAKVTVTMEIEVDDRIGLDAEYYGWRQTPEQHTYDTLRDVLYPFMQGRHDWNGRTIRIDSMTPKVWVTKDA